MIFPRRFPLHNFYFCLIFIVLAEISDIMNFCVHGVFPFYFFHFCCSAINVHSMAMLDCIGYRDEDQPAVSPEPGPQVLNSFNGKWWLLLLLMAYIRA